MVAPANISNYISLSDDFSARSITPQVKEVLKDFIDALSTTICDEEWRMFLNINSATKKMLDNLDNLSYTRRTSFQGNDTLHNEEVQFKLTYPVKNGEHKENIEFQAVINSGPIYLDNFRHGGGANIFALPTQSLLLWDAYFGPASNACYFYF